MTRSTAAGSGVGGVWYLSVSPSWGAVPPSCRAVAMWAGSSTEAPLSPTTGRTSTGSNSRLDARARRTCRWSVPAMLAPSVDDPVDVFAVECPPRSWLDCGCRSCRGLGALRGGMLQLVDSRGHLVELGLELLGATPCFDAADFCFHRREPDLVEPRGRDRGHQRGSIADRDV